jgi:hypothetical protein
VTETPLSGPPNTGAPEPETKSGGGGAAAVAIWIGIAGAFVAVAAAYLVVRTMWGRRPPDETTERIQALIDEANRLIRTLEEKK